MIQPHPNFDFLLTGNAWAVIGIFSGVSFFIGYFFANANLKKRVSWVNAIPKEDKALYVSQYKEDMAQLAKLQKLSRTNPLGG